MSGFERMGALRGRAEEALGRRGFRIAVGAGLFVFLFFFFYEIAFLGDYPGHYTFAVDLKLLRDMGIREFIAQEKDYHILSYPAWHLVFLLLLTALNAGLDLISPGLIGTHGRYAVVIGVENGLILVGTFWLMYAFIRRFAGGENNRFRAFAVSAALLFAGPLYAPFINRTYDLGQLLVTPWYNPTTIAVKPLAVICLWLYMELLEGREKGETAKERKDKGAGRENKMFFLLGAALFVSGLVKPSFFQMFVPALFLYCVIDVLASRFRSFWFCFKTGLCVAPVCLLAVFQLWISFYSQSGKGVRFGLFHGWSVFSEHIFLSALISIAFPLAVLILWAKRLWKEKPLFLALLCFFSGAAQYAFLYEENNEGCGNFSWGASIGTFLLFLVCGVYYVRGLSGKKSRAGGVAAGVLLMLHVACGLIYFARIFAGGALWTSLI